MSWNREQTPAYAGRCAFAVSLGKKDVAGKENCCVIQHGKKYLFSNHVAKFLWVIFPGFKNKADAHWNER